ncbi:MAG: L-ribulose-5-phosphate 4-epimerase [Verrucomicrobia bacterium]|nr:MAG: L-ribulose-5-phosphate 4-epimerase [Verrucomicrobiota bacterium]
MLEELKEEVFQANIELPARGLVTYTWGNVSAIDRDSGRVVIKPSGVDYENMQAKDMVVIDLDGKVVEGDLNPSSDAPTHVELYKAFPAIGGVCHTHSRWATTFAQSGRGVPAYGTTHADYFYGAVPCSRDLTEEEIKGEYEKNTGLVIVETFQGLDPMQIPAVLVKNHGPFTWGKDAAASVYHSVVLEEVGRMAWELEAKHPGIEPMPQVLLDKHFLRKHGPGSYYGQG